MLNKNGNFCLYHGLLEREKKETDEDLILVKDGGKYRIAWDVRAEVNNSHIRCYIWCILNWLERIVIDIIWESCPAHREDVKEIMTNNVNMLY